MAIQFKCRECGQAIEVDDELAEQSAECPYCHAVVTVPRESRLEESPPAEPAPVASATRGARPRAEADSRTEASAPERSGKSQLGWLALGCIGLSVACMFIGMLILMPLARRWITASNAAEYMRMVQEDGQDAPGRTYSGLIALLVGAYVFPFVGVVLAVMALIRQAEPRWPAFVTLAIVALLLVVVVATKFAGPFSG